LPDEPGNQYLDTSRIKADLGWSPRFDIDSMLADYIAWLRNNEY
jgi:UDP-glucose 4-epimerase